MQAMDQSVRILFDTGRGLQSTFSVKPNDKVKQVIQLFIQKCGLPQEANITLAFAAKPLNPNDLFLTDTIREVGQVKVIIVPVVEMILE